MVRFQTFIVPQFSVELSKSEPIAGFVPGKTKVAEVEDTIVWLWKQLAHLFKQSRNSFERS